MRGRLQASFAAYKAGALSLDGMILESRAFAVSVGRLEGREDAEDLAQEACIQVWKHIDRFDGERGSFATWLRKILRNLIRDKVRHARSVLAGAQIVETPGRELAMDDSGDARLRDLKNLPMTLTLDQTDLVRALVDGVELRDIADTAGVSLKAVRGRFDRIRDRCRG
ncbi:MAG TPA: sigma-70 family RNA polymerase sigma factor [Acidobacteriaceae bacterium]